MRKVWSHVKLYESPCILTKIRHETTMNENKISESVLWTPKICWYDVFKTGCLRFRKRAVWTLKNPYNNRNTLSSMNKTCMQWILLELTFQCLCGPQRQPKKGGPAVGMGSSVWRLMYWTSGFMETVTVSQELWWMVILWEVLSHTNHSTLISFHGRTGCPGLAVFHRNRLWCFSWNIYLK